MDVHRKGGDTVIKCETEVKSVKRPFDVAFLMLPDDKVKKATKIVKSASFEPDVTCYNNNDEDEDVDIEEVKVNHQKFFTQKQQIFDDPNLIKNTKYEPLRNPEQKSAFTKVNLTKESPRMSPNLSLSPDLTYQSSLSPSPPIINRNFPYTQNMLFKANPGMYPANFMPEFPQQEHQLMPKFRPAMYRPELTYNYQQFPNHQDLLKTDLKLTPDIRSPAAAILTSLLPPSLAALSLPGQNVCAKCNITFRMTSDLVYHMRSHHKNEAGDMHKRRREEKLKCPVCGESFRERHHLTRHMTAHQDKDDDDKEAKKDL
ncbi:zinc finger protein 488 [Anthonomus grandis grandis]|uniref:zinc finger protein 488 n=1 Tax=Anthonomus grandis grandis TaxID=2921223 RepID=UPI0021658C19|nr:zinc finger protein 488 [Anthonomus grandis grandis]